MRNKKLLRSVLSVFCAAVLVGVGVSEPADAASRYVCNKCGKSLSSAYQSHTRECGGSVQPYQWYCSTCGQTLSSSGSHTTKCSACWGSGSVTVYCNGALTAITVSETTSSDPYYLLNRYKRTGTCTKCGRVSTRYYTTLEAASTDSSGVCLLADVERCSKCSGTGTVSCSGTPTASAWRCVSCNTTYSSSSSSSCTASIECDGTGVLQDCTLSFNASVNGGSTAAASQRCDIGSSVSLTGKTASKSGWEFVGWNTNRTAKAGLNSVNMNSDTTVYAVFKKDLTANFVDC